MHEGAELTSSLLLACLPSLKEFGNAAATNRLQEPVESTVVICRVALVEGSTVADESLPPLSFSQMVHSATSTSWQGPAVRFPCSCYTASCETCPTRYIALASFSTPSEC